MLQSLALRRQAREIEKRLRMNPGAGLSAFRAAIREYRGLLVERGVMDRYTGEIDFKKLKELLKKDGEFARRFYTTVAEKSGLPGDKLVVGKAITNMGIRAGLAARGLGGGGLAAVAAVEVARLNALGDHLARRFAGGSFSEFIKKYNNDEKFRARVNAYITRLVNNEKTFAGLKGYKPEEIVGGITAVKAVTMSRGDLLRDAAKPMGKELVKILVAHGAVFAMAAGTVHVLSASSIALSGNPHLAHALHMSYYTMRSLSSLNMPLLLYARDAARGAHRPHGQQLG